MTLNEQWKIYQDALEEDLGKLLPQSEETFSENAMPKMLAESMRYSVLGGGKRLRGSLLLATVELFEGDISEAMLFASALEMIHAYSLVHDDLPGMDNDDTRRGKPTNHRVYGEGMAILAGDALLNYAYERMLEYCSDVFAPKHLLRAMFEISKAAGVTGMIAGQCIDLTAGDVGQNADTLAYIHQHKTSDLITAPLMAGAYLCDAYAEDRRMLRTYGQAVGLAFQITDDLLDVRGDAQEMGKATGMDEKRGKLTFPGLHGVARSEEVVRQLTEEALEAIVPFGKAGWFLSDLCKQLTGRSA